MKLKYISTNKEILGGSPVIEGTRIPVERLLHLIKMGYSNKDIKKEFPQIQVKIIRSIIFDLTSSALNRVK